MRLIPYRALFLLLVGIVSLIVGALFLWYSGPSDYPVFRGIPTWFDDNEHGIIWTVGGSITLLCGLFLLSSPNKHFFAEKLGFVAGIIPGFTSGITIILNISVSPPGAVVIAVFSLGLGVACLLVSSWVEPSAQRPSVIEEPPETKEIPWS